MGQRTKGPNVGQIRHGLRDTQTSSSNGRAASGVVKQTAGSMQRGDRKDPLGSAQVGVGKGLAHSQTRNSSSVVSQSRRK